MQVSGIAPLRAVATRLAASFRSGYKSNTSLARLTGNPFVSPGVVLTHPDVSLGRSVFLGEDVILYSADGSGSVSIGERSCMHHGVIFETSLGGCVRIGANTHIQPRCHLTAAKGSIHIGSNVQIAPACGFYPYSHGMALGTPMREQPMTSSGDIVIADDAWIGYGVIVLENTRIGEGAVVAAGAVVREDVPDLAIVAGVPARVVGCRTERS